MGDLESLSNSLLAPDGGDDECDVDEDAFGKGGEAFAAAAAAAASEVVAVPGTKGIDAGLRPFVAEDEAGVFAWET